MSQMTCRADDAERILTTRQRVHWWMYAVQTHYHAELMHKESWALKQQWQHFSVQYHM